MKTGDLLHVRGGLAPQSRVFMSINGNAREINVDENGAFAFDVKMLEGESSVFIGAYSRSGATAAGRIILPGAKQRAAWETE
jgi:hypothetical protein